MVTNRDAFQQTLDISREVGNENESATIIRDVVEFNKWLAQEKLDNTTWWFDQYIDDRIIDVEPIQ